MKVVALLSGGKDSTYALAQCVRLGHCVVAVANLYPPQEITSSSGAAASADGDPTAGDELDSFTFQTVGYQGIEAIAEALGVRLFRRPLLGKPVRTALDYEPTSNDEVETLFQLLSDVKRDIPDVEGVSTGAILSDYQRLRIENV